MVTGTYAFGARLLTIREASRILHVHENTVRRMCDLGIVKSYRIGPRADRRLLEEDVRALNGYVHGNHSCTTSREL